MPVGIISNTSALNAQSNLNKANLETQASTSRLSSGFRIDKASTDVAGLAIGTILQTNISTLKAALNNTAQAGSLLGVADGALKNIGEILQRQKALAAQATSGSLDSSTRAFLDAEFQNLTLEIDRISDTTNFNGIKLVDGSLYTPTKWEFRTENASVQAQNTITIANPLATTEYLRFSVNGNDVDITARANADMGVGTEELNFDVAANATVAAQRDAIFSIIENIKSYGVDVPAGGGTNAALLAAKATLSALDITTSGTDAFIVRAQSAFDVGTTIQVESNGAGGDEIELNGTALATSTATDLDANGGTAGVNNDLQAGSFATGGGTAYAGGATTIAQGSRGDQIITAINTVAAAAGSGNATGVSAAGISNNADFVGTVQGFEATYLANDRVNLEMTVGDFTYRAKNIDTTPAAATIVRLASDEDGGGYFDLQLDTGANSGQTAITDQADADQFATRLNKAIETVSFYQNRRIDNFTAAGTVFPTGSTTASGDLAGSQFNLISNDFSDVKVENVSVRAPVTGATNAEIEITINGEIYRSGFSNIGAAAALGTNIGAAGSIGLVNVNNPLSILQFTNGATQIDITNSAQAEGLEKALNEAFGIKTGASGSLTFQVGTKSEDAIDVSIESTSTKDLFLNGNGISTAIDISTVEGAATAQEILDTAINKVTTIRAQLGALQSRFNFASSNIESSIQNQDAARSVFLDTDVAAESTSFAQSQVRLNASISVLAQANQMPQNLLKLIG